MVDPALAVRPGIDLPRYSSHLASVHEAFLTGDRLAARPRDVVARSWRRVRRHGVDPDQPAPPAPLPQYDVNARRADPRLTSVLPELRSCVAGYADDAMHIMVVTDADGVVLWREGASSVRRRADHLGFVEGAAWDEDSVGTNAIGVALVERAPVQLFAAEHFVRTHHAWTCSASPLIDPLRGDVYGVLDISGPRQTVNATTLALTRTAARLAETVLVTAHQQRLDRLRVAAAPLLARVRGAGVVVDGDGWVAAASGTAFPGRRLPPPTSKRPLAVPGLGVCLPEPFAGGWLLRPPRSAEPDRPVRLVLDLEARPPQLRLESADPWVYPLSTRHAEVLVLLARHRAGLDAAALSTALYGHSGARGTARSEMSRLRHALGGFVLARPYRLPAGVQVDIPGLAGSRFLHASTAPGVRALGRR